jgi:hypothetical protein
VAATVDVLSQCDKSISAFDTKKVRIILKSKRKNGLGIMYSVVGTQVLMVKVLTYFEWSVTSEVRDALIIATRQTLTSNILGY